MTAILRMRCEWGGSGVTGPGLTTFYFDQAGSGFPADVRTFFEAIKANIPSNTTITVPNGGDIIEDTTGVLSGSWSEPSGVTTSTEVVCGCPSAGELTLPGVMAIGVTSRAACC